MSPVQLFFLLLLVLLLLLIGGLLIGTSGSASARASGQRSKRRQNRQSGKGLDEDLHADEQLWDSHSESLPQGNDTGDTQLPRPSRRNPFDPVDTVSERVGYNAPQSTGSTNRPIEIDTSSEEPVLSNNIPGISTNPASIGQEQPPVSLRSRSKLYHYTAFVTKVYDGDTLTVDIDLGMDMLIKNQVIRLWKINTPEVKGATRQEGLEVRDLVRELVLDKFILLRTILDKRGRDKTGKYGRLLGEILLEDDSGTINVNEYLLAKGLAIPFGADGSAIRVPSPSAAPQRSASPMPGGFPDDAPWRDDDRRADTPQNLPAASIGELSCPYCGEDRAVELNERRVLACQNCMDDSYFYE